jgi:hypothetical protein
MFVVMRKKNPESTYSKNDLKYRFVAVFITSEYMKVR